ncbi:MAG: 30S ribosomal protein S4 [Bacteroidetes bacterium]|nr:30S ribosomal protein S4 [Bacteroidota bacterium]
MARYTGPKQRINRKFAEPILGGNGKTLEKKAYPPGMHGMTKKRGKKSEYAGQLAEKQKAKYTYGILERQFENTFERAARAKGVTGEVLLQLLESRLDNVVYRMNLASTRRGARQLVSHKHITVNGNVVNIPSYTVKPGDLIGVRERSKDMDPIRNSLAGSSVKYQWLEFDQNLMQGKFMALPERTQIPENIKEQLIVELYSK